MNAGTPKRFKKYNSQHDIIPYLHKQVMRYVEPVHHLKIMSGIPKIEIEKRGGNLYLNNPYFYTNI
jgi:hypothetical protein